MVKKITQETGNSKNEHYRYNWNTKKWVEQNSVNTRQLGSPPHEDNNQNLSPGAIILIVIIVILITVFFSWLIWKGKRTDRKPWKYPQLGRGGRM